jgi:superfamily II DNA or RNA helicase
MKVDLFKTLKPFIAANDKLRTPQREAHAALEAFAADTANSDREIGVVLPVGCGKSGCIACAAFAFRARRVLVVAPGVNIAEQLFANYFDPTKPQFFFKKCGVLSGPQYPEPAPIRGTTINRGDLDEADVVITNIQQLQGEENRWLTSLPADFFDLILFDEGHHSVAATWETLKTKFPAARIVNYSATPLRADGQKMAGKIVYSYPIFRAIQEGYVKRLKALVLNPKTLRYVRRNDGEEIEVPLEEVRRLGEEDADFRRAIVTSKETLDTIVNASIRELDALREKTGEPRLKIIASALNYEHCRQIVAAYAARNRRADYVHSKEDGAANARVLKKLEAHELDVIVQVRKLGEGFDHPFLSVAAVFSIFANLSPFVQFVGRIMRVIKQNAPDDPVNQGTVIFHAGANVAKQWEDFQDYSEADKAFFQQLLPIEGLDFETAKDIEITPRAPNTVEVRSQTGVQVEEIPLLENDDEAMRAIQTLRARGYTGDEVARVMDLEPVPTTKAGERQAARAALDTRVKTEVARLLKVHKCSPEGHDLDKQRRGRTNFVVLKSAVDRLGLTRFGGRFRYAARLLTECRSSNSTGLL